MVIAEVGEGDLADLLPLMSAYCEFYGAAPGADSLLALSRTLLEDPEHHGMQLIARRQEHGAPLGFATLYWSWSTLRAGRIAVMNDLYVATDARGAGVGAALIDACRERCRERGMTRLEWRTAADNVRAQRLYDSVGAKRSEWIDYGLDPGGASSRATSASCRAASWGVPRSPRPRPARRTSTWASSASRPAPARARTTTPTASRRSTSCRARWRCTGASAWSRSCASSRATSSTSRHARRTCWRTSPKPTPPSTSSPATRRTRTPSRSPGPSAGPARSPRSSRPRATRDTRPARRPRRRSPSPRGARPSG